MKENKELMREVLKDVRRDMSDEEIVELLADSKVSVNTEKETSTPYFPVSSTTPSSVFISASGLLMVARARQMKLIISLFSSPRWAACS